MQIPDPTDLDAAHAAQEETARGAAKRREQEIADFRWLMSDPHGRRFVWRLMSEGGVFYETFVPGDALATAHREGKRVQGLKLLNEVLEVCPEHWVNMMRDQKKQ